MQESQQEIVPTITDKEAIMSDAGRIVGDLTNQINKLVALRRQVRERRDLTIQDSAITMNKTRGKPKIIEDIQLFPPVDNRTQTQQQEWQTVLRKKPKKKKKGTEQGGTPDTRGPGKGAKQIVRSDVSKPGRQRIPKTAAVTIKPNTEGYSYAEVLRSARESVSLKDIGIEDFKIRKARNGAIVIEIPHAEVAGMADVLAERLRDVYGEKATVARPMVKDELRLIGIDDSVLLTGISVMVAEFGGCKLEEVYMSEIRPMRNGMGIA